MSIREKIIAGILMVFILMAFQAENPFSQKASQTLEIQAGSVRPGSSDEDLRFILKGLTSSRQYFDPHEIKNPFTRFELKALGNADLEFDDLVLTGIIMGEQPEAIINNKIMKEGEKFADFELKEIHQNDVILMRGLEKYVLKLF